MLGLVFTEQFTKTMSKTPKITAHAALTEVERPSDSLDAHFGTAGTHASLTSSRPMSRPRPWLAPVALLLFTVLAAVASNSRVSPLQQHRQLSENDQEVYARLLEEQTAMADDEAACNASASSSVLSTYLSALPSVAGLQGCIATNIAQLYPSIAGSGSQCNLTTLSSLVSGDSDDSAAFSEVLNLLLAGVVSSSGSGSSSTDLSSALSSWSDDSSTLQGFCSVMNTGGALRRGAAARAPLAPG